MNSSTPASAPTREQLQASLRALHEQLANTTRIDADLRRPLQQLLTDMQRLLQSTPPDAPTAAARPSERPSERLESLAVEFEAEHPRLAGSLRQFIELCSRAGL